MQNTAAYPHGLLDSVLMLSSSIHGVNIDVLLRVILVSIRCQKYSVVCRKDAVYIQSMPRKTGDNTPYFCACYCCTVNLAAFIQES